MVQFGPYPSSPPARSRCALPPYTWPSAPRTTAAVDFAPYVASINEQGVEALQATFVEGLSGVFYSDGWAATDGGGLGCP